MDIFTKLAWLSLANLWLLKAHPHSIWNARCNYFFDTSFFLIIIIGVALVLLKWVKVIDGFFKSNSLLVFINKRIPPLEYFFENKLIINISIKLLKTLPPYFWYWNINDSAIQYFWSTIKVLSKHMIWIIIFFASTVLAHFSQ